MTTNLNVTELEVYNEIKSLFYDDFRFDDLVEKSKLSLTENQLKRLYLNIIKKRFN
jgi:hypothetical protein